MGSLSRGSSHRISTALLGVLPYALTVVVFTVVFAQAIVLAHYAWTSDFLGFVPESARRFGESPILLNDDERHLVTSVPASNIQQFYEAMAVVVERLEAAPFYQDQYVLGEHLPNRSLAGSKWPEIHPRTDQVSAA